MHHTQVMQFPIFNDCLKVNIDGHIRPQIVPKLLLQVSVIELYKTLVSAPVDVELKESRDAENHIIACYYTLHSLLPL